MNPRILITGASGFIGSFIVEEALNRGFETWAAVRKSSSREFLQDERIHFIELNLSSEEQLKQQLKDIQFDYVVHAAGVTKCLHKEDFFRINTEGTKNLVRALLDLQMPLKRFVYISSLSIMGAIREEQPYKEIREQDKAMPNTAYGKSKLEAEQWLALVPVSFTQQLNTYMYRDPFSLTDRPYGPVVYAADFKYEFAREMASLERSIASTTDPDRKALLLLKFATGMKSSITQCWALTFYGKTSADTDPTWEPPTEYAKNSNRILAQADMLFRQAKAKAYSPEVKAQIQLTLGNLKTVMEQYACTEVAASIRGHCDTYADYHLDAKERAGYGAWR